MLNMERQMETSALSVRQAHRLLQFGLVLFLLALLVGLVVPRFAVPRLGLSVHLLGILQGIFLVAIGLLWPKLTLSRVTSRVAFWSSIYGCYSAWTANILAAIWGAGNALLPLAAGQARGSLVQERIIAFGLRSAAASLVATLILLLWGLRVLTSDPSNK